MYDERSGAFPTRTSATLSAQPSPYRTHTDAIHTNSRQISPSPPTTAHMKIALSTAAPEQRTCIDVGHGLHALLGVQVADSRGMERNFDQLCTADATSAYCERSTHSSVLRSSIEASAQLAMVLLCQAGDHAASHWPMVVVSRYQSSQPSEISRQAAIRHAHTRSRACDRPEACDYRKREHKTEYKTLSRSTVFCIPKIRIHPGFYSSRDPDFAENRS